MRTLLLLLALAAGLLLLRARREPDPGPEADDMARPFLDSRNSATWLYNPATGCLSSYN